MPGARLTPAVHDALVHAVEARQSVEIAAEGAGVGRRTVFRWLARHQAADHQIAQALASQTAEWIDSLDERDADERDVALLTLADVDPREWPYWKLGRDIVSARARSAAEALNNLRECAVGYESTETRTEVRQVLRDGEVIELTSTITTTRFVRDWRADAWWLERAPGVKADFAREQGTQRLEVTGQGGGPVELDAGETREERTAALKDRALRIVRRVPDGEEPVEVETG